MTLKLNRSKVFVMDKQYTMFDGNWTQNCRSVVFTRVLLGLTLLMSGDLQL